MVRVRVRVSSWVRIGVRDGLLLSFSHFCILRLPGPAAVRSKSTSNRPLVSLPMQTAQEATRLIG